jgi:hypothetical protein
MRIHPWVHCLILAFYFMEIINYQDPNLTGFVAVLRIRIRQISMFLGLLDPDPDPLVRGTDPDPSIIKQKKIVSKTLIPTVL